MSNVKLNSVCGVLLGLSWYVCTAHAQTTSSALTNGIDLLQPQNCSVLKFKQEALVVYLTRANAR